LLKLLFKSSSITLKQQSGNNAHNFLKINIEKSVCENQCWQLVTRL